MYSPARVRQLSQSHSVAGFVVGAVYNRQQDIHKRFGGRWQYGIAPSPGHPYIFLFSSNAGRRHGYYDSYDDDGMLHYFGEGQTDDMEMRGNNLAVRDHRALGKRLLVFRLLGEGYYRFLGEFDYTGDYSVPSHPGSDGQPRRAIVFKLRPLNDCPGADPELYLPVLLEAAGIEGAERRAIENFSETQRLFRKRVSLLEVGCRLTGVGDLRFLRASHIKPWQAANDAERVDPHNGLLLTPSADLLFSRGWITFRENGRLLVSTRLPSQVRESIGIRLEDERKCGTFTRSQAAYLEYHRDCVFTE